VLALDELMGHCPERSCTIVSRNAPHVASDGTESTLQHVKCRVRTSDADSGRGDPATVLALVLSIVNDFCEYKLGTEHDLVLKQLFAGSEL
jgi:hypothetical protein